MSEKTERVWECQIGGIVGELPPGCDGPMRDAVRRAFKEITGENPEFIFSGWGAELNDVQRVIVDSDREKLDG